MFRLPMLASERGQVSVEHGDKERVLSAVFGGAGGEESDSGDEIDGGEENDGSDEIAGGDEIDGGEQSSVLARETRGDAS